MFYKDLKQQARQPQLTTFFKASERNLVPYSPFPIELRFAVRDFAIHVVTKGCNLAKDKGNLYRMLRVGATWV